MAVFVLAIVAIVAAACGGDEPSPAPPVAPEPAPPAADAGPNTLPDVTVLDVASGESVVVSSLAPADRPILVWVWAPH